MSDLTASLTAPQIRRRANDYDAQIRQGLDDGNVRQVVKRLGKDLVSRISVFLLIFTDIWLDRTVDPSYERHTGTKGCISKAPVPVRIRSGLEQKQERPELPGCPAGHPQEIRRRSTISTPPARFHFDTAPDCPCSPSPEQTPHSEGQNCHTPPCCSGNCPTSLTTSPYSPTD
jgi:hypothetical protein